MNEHRVWIPYDGGWTTGKILTCTGQKSGMIKVLTDEGKELIVNKDQVIDLTESVRQVVDDLITLDELHEPLILHNLRERYLQSEIYTYIGSIIISVNPFEYLNQYGDHLISDYRNNKKEELPPHLYALADSAYQNLVNIGQSQSIIISGESGSGKTEATKIILKYITVVSEGPGDDLSEAILATNPILEAFGNAKTVRNNNSSRFGKLIKINFDRSGKICGASINNYLLENTRIVYQAPEERNYHIFYQFLAGTTREQKKRYRLLDSANDYKYLSHGNLKCPGMEDGEMFNVVLKSFKKLGISEEEVDQFLTFLSGILHLGNIEFAGTDRVTISNMKEFSLVCDLLNLNEQITNSALTARLFTGGNRTTSYYIPLNYSQAVENRDALAKAFYSKLFDYLIKRINQSLAGNSEENLPFLAVLDIYGFEVFAKNSLEQFCINYANEKLHEQFNESIFKAEQTEYKNENIPWKEIKYQDNKVCIELIEKSSTGIIALLNEECQLPKGSDINFVNRLIQTHGRNSFFPIFSADAGII